MNGRRPTPIFATHFVSEEQETPETVSQFADQLFKRVPALLADSRLYLCVLARVAESDRLCH
jgi:hypothetical protein